MEDRLTYKIGEKYAMLFVKKGMDDIVFVLEHAMEVLAENLRVCIDRLCNSITEIFENNIEKPKLPRHPKNICPNKTAPFRRIIPHARTVC